MVENAKYALRHLDLDPLLIAKAYGLTENECWDYLTRYNEALNKIAGERDDLAIKKEVLDWVETIPDKNNIRIEALKEQLVNLKETPDSPEVDKLITELRVLQGRVERPTPEMIQRAKDFPIAQLLNTQGKKGNVSCPFHKDRTPSFQIKKNNTWTCYSCGEYGDSISLYQKLNNVGFIQAVINLQ